MKMIEFYKIGMRNGAPDYRVTNNGQRLGLVYKMDNLHWTFWDHRKFWDNCELVSDRRNPRHEYTIWDALTMFDSFEDARDFVKESI
jgi:hypothetical protein